jgi:fibronectin type 3 domain-containing protein
MSILLASFFPVASAAGAADFLFKAAADSQSVILVWSEQEGTTGLNIYRRITGGSYAKINAAPVIPLTDCADIRSVIPAGSPEDSAVARILKIKTCDINNSRSERVKHWSKAREVLAHRYHRIALVRGQAYEDRTVVSGTTYFYAIKAIEAGRERSLAADLTVQAGLVIVPEPPAVLAITAGDRQLFLRWSRVQSAMTYHVMRSTSATGPFQEVTSDQGVSGLFQYDPITTDSLTPSSPGYFDTTCSNNTTYYYKVFGRDFLGRDGVVSAAASATPRDMTPPETPQGITVQPLKYGLQLTWSKVELDILGRTERLSGYHVFRYDSHDEAVKDSAVAAAAFVNQAKLRVKNVSYKDTLIAPTKTHWYRLQAEDNATPSPNLSSKSAAVSGFYKDPVPPGPPKGLSSSGFEDSIMIRWLRPEDADVAGYNIYRGICGCETVYVFQRRDVATGTFETVESRKVRTMGPWWKLTRKYCRPYTLSLIVNIDSAQATSYTDRSLPKGSPICYRYAMNAYDTTQNLSVMSDSICDRLKDRTGPPSPVLAGLQARDRAVLVQWVESPIQDLYGFNVERAEQQQGPWTKISPSLKLPDPATLGCRELSGTNAWADSTYSFLDTNAVRPNRTYWYRVRAVDYSGVEGEPSPEISTFTYDRRIPQKPVILTTADASPQGIAVTWDPGYDTSYLGFAVFRSKGSSARFFQVSRLIRGNTFVDHDVIRGQEYYYQVQCIFKNGNPSLPSDPKAHALQ